MRQVPVLQEALLAPFLPNDPTASSPYGLSGRAKHDDGPATDDEGADSEHVQALHRASVLLPNRPNEICLLDRDLAASFQAWFLAITK